MSEAIYRKYRPSTFADVTGQEHVKRTIQNQLTSGTIAHAYLFTGPRGVGKTTIARLIAKAVNCLASKDGEPCNTCESCAEIIKGAAMDVFEIDAASHTDVANVRENIIENIRFAPAKLKYKVFIIDEVHMLSNHAFNALLKTMEEPPAHALFVLATTEIHKVPQTIISRCQRYDFRRLPITDLVERMKGIVKEEGVKMSEEVLHEIARHSDGCARDAESLLGQVLALGEKKIDMEIASLVLPATTSVLVAQFVEAVLQHDAEQAIGHVTAYVEQGVDMPVFLDDVIQFVRDLLLARLGGMHQVKDRYAADVLAKIESLLPTMDPSRLTSMIETFLMARNTWRSEQIPQLGAEMAVVKLCMAPTPLIPCLPAGKAPSGRGEDVSKIPRQARDDEKNAVFLAQSKGADLPPLPVNRDTDPPLSPLRKEGNEVPPAAPFATPTALGNIPVISLDAVKNKWPAIFEQVKTCNASLPLVMQGGRVNAVNGDEIEIHFNFRLHADTINQQKNNALLQEVFERVLGQKVRVKGAYAHQEADEAVDALLEGFGGTVS